MTSGASSSAYTATPLTPPHFKALLSLHVPSSTAGCIRMHPAPQLQVATSLLEYVQKACFADWFLLRRSLLAGKSLKMEREFAKTDAGDETMEGLRKGMMEQMMEPDWKPRLDSMLRSVLSRSSDEVRDACIPAGEPLLSYRLLSYRNTLEMMTRMLPPGTMMYHEITAI